MAHKQIDLAEDDLSKIENSPYSNSDVRGRLLFQVIDEELSENDLKPKRLIKILSNMLKYFDEDNIEILHTGVRDYCPEEISIVAFRLEEESAYKTRIESQKKKIKEKDKIRKLKREESDRKQYERLKKKFEK